MIVDSATQVRVAGLGGVVGLDFAAILSLAAARGLNLRLTGEVLPAVEPYIVFAWSLPK